MREKCIRKGVPETTESTLSVMKDAIGIRVICSFVDDVYSVVEYVRSFKDCDIIKEKDYIKHTKPNGYRSYHMILAVKSEYKDVLGNTPGVYYVEMQIRTIAMDTWAALEHKMKYKKDIPNQELLVSELKRVADELTSCDLSMQTIRGIDRISRMKRFLVYLKPYTFRCIMAPLFKMLEAGFELLVPLVIAQPCGCGHSKWRQTQHHQLRASSFCACNSRNDCRHYCSVFLSQSGNGFWPGGKRRSFQTYRKSVI